MIRFLFRRLLLTIPVLVGVATLVFSLVHLVPGDPVQAMLGDSASPEDMAEMRTRLGLDRPLVVQYVAFVKGVATGDLGTSLRTNRAVITRITERLPATFELAAAAMTSPSRSRSRSASSRRCGRERASIMRRRRWRSWVSRCRHSGSGPLLAIVFSVSLGWLPVSGRGTFAHLVLPAITLGAPLAAVLARMTRASVLEELRELYVLAARARGVSRMRAVLRHAFRNSLIPIVTVLGLQFGAVLTGAVITETIFAWPGVGRLLIQSISFRDYPAVQGCILLIAVTYVSMNLLVDLVYGFLDPRIRYEWDLRPRREARSGPARPRCSRLARASSIVAALAALLGPALTPFDPSAQDLALRLAGPTATHPFGLDELGRDILARVLAGARISFFVGLVVVSSRRSSGHSSARSRAISAACSTTRLAG